MSYAPSASTPSKRIQISLWRVLDDYDHIQGDRFVDITELDLFHGRVDAPLFYKWVTEQVVPVENKVLSANESLHVYDAIPTKRNLTTYSQLPPDADELPTLAHDLLLGGVGGFLAVAMILCEFSLILHANAIILMIGGVIKEMITIGMG